MAKKKNRDLKNLVDQLDHIDVEIAATHLNYVNGNAVLYTTDAAKNGGKSWLKPYAKPQLLHHDKHKDAVGRVIDYKLKDDGSLPGEPNEYIQLKVRITDKDAISKVVKGIYYTCSVGSSTSSIRCSICDQVLTVDGLCEHEKGSIYEGKKVYWIIDTISYRENSFVNSPADIYSRITSIDIGDGPMNYDKFLEDKENILTDFIMEDNMAKQANAKLTSEGREKLPESAFCGPSRSFPAHDADHVNAGLKLIMDSELSDDAKAKITASLYRKGKRYGIEPQDGESVDLLFRMDDEFTDEEVAELADFFKANPDADLPDLLDSDEGEEKDEENSEVTYTIDDYEEIKKGKKDEIIAFCDWIVGEFTKLTDTINDMKDNEKSLNDKISEQDTILNSKEDEINKLLDDNATLSVDYKKALVDNILDFKQVTDNRDEESKKFGSRKVDSLIDTLSDFRNESETLIPKVNDETLKDSTESDNDDDDNNNSDGIKLDDTQSRIDRFFKKNILTEE